MFSKARRDCSIEKVRWAKQRRSQIERRNCKNKLHMIDIDNTDDFDIKPLAQTKSGYWAWVLT